MGIKPKPDADPFELMRQRFNVRFRASELFIMPYFNDFLGGRPINRKIGERSVRSVEYLGPILRTGSVDTENAETYLLDGTFLGTVNQLRSFN